MNSDKNALIELEHIKLELDNKRTRHFRHFVDQYVAYNVGAVSKGGNPKTNSIPGYRTDNSRYLDKRDLIKEHIVPLKVITDKLVELPVPVELGDIQVVIEQFVKFAYVTREDDAKLRSKGLNNHMPQSFYNESSHLYQDVFARYKTCGINLYEE